MGQKRRLQEREIGCPATSLTELIEIRREENGDICAGLEVLMCDNASKD